MEAAVDTSIRKAYSAPEIHVTRFSGRLSVLPYLYVY